MTAIKSITDDSLARLRSGGTRVSARIGQLTQSEPMSSLRQHGGWRGIAERCWLGFQETRSKPVGELFPASKRQSVVSSVVSSVVPSADRHGSDHQPLQVSGVVYEGSLAVAEPAREVTAGSLLPMAIIVAGLGGLSILAVLKNGPSDNGAMPLAQTGNKPSVTQVASADTGRSINGSTDFPAMPAVPAGKAPTIKPAAGANTKQPMQLAATIAPVVFETGAAPLNTKSDAPSSELNQKTVKPPGVSHAESRVAKPPEEAVAMQMLKGENERLKEMMAALEYETLSLNSELLKLELSLSQAEEDSAGEPEQVVETLTVYNFVNVPVGGAVEVSAPPPEYTENYNNNLPSATYVDNTYRDSRDPYIQQGASDPAFIAELPAPEMGFSPGGQFMPPNDQLYANDNAGRQPDPYLNQNDYIQSPGFIEQTEAQLYGSGADIQYGPADQSMDARRYPPVPPVN